MKIIKYEEKGLHENEKAQINIEVGMLMSHDCPNIIKCYEAFDFAGCYFIVLELMNGAILHMAERFNKMEYSENIVKYVLSQVMNGVSYLHS